MYIYIILLVLQTFNGQEYSHIRTFTLTLKLNAEVKSFLFHLSGMTHYGSFVRVKYKAREWDADDSESASLVEAV